MRSIKVFEQKKGRIFRVKREWWYRMRKEISITNKIVDYIKSNQITVNQMAYDTGIPQEKLVNEEGTLNATEFLEICAYLNLRPEDIK